jgi:hypothetical protein
MVNNLSESVFDLFSSFSSRLSTLFLFGDIVNFMEFDRLIELRFEFVARFRERAGAADATTEPDSSQSERRRPWRVC